MLTIAGISYVVCGLVAAAMVRRVLRKVRELCPRFASAVAATPLVSVPVALCRGIAYYEPPSIGPWTFPPLGKLILIFAFCVAIIVWTFAIKPYYRTTREWGSPPLAVRAGMLATGLFPFLLSAGLKVNLITILTGISHERLQIFHQWFARLFLFLSIVHTIPFIQQPLAEGGRANLHAYFFSEPIYVTGVVAFVLLVWIVLSGTRVVRSLSYECFVLQHVAVAIAFTVMMFIHVESLLNSHLWLWAGVAMWIFSTAVRLGMTIVASAFFSGAHARVEVQSEIAAQQSLTSRQAQDGLETLVMSFDTPIRWAPYVCCCL